MYFNKIHKEILKILKECKDRVNSNIGKCDDFEKYETIIKQVSEELKLNNNKAESIIKKAIDSLDQANYIKKGNDSVRSNIITVKIASKGEKALKFNLLRDWIGPVFAVIGGIYAFIQIIKYFNTLTR